MSILYSVWPKQEECFFLAVVISTANCQLRLNALL